MFFNNIELRDIQTKSDLTGVTLNFGRKQLREFKHFNS